MTPAPDPDKATPSPPVEAEVAELVAAFTADEALLPPAPWELWTSCSYRRIKRREGYTTKEVLTAYNQAGDGHPDLSMPEDQLAALVRLRNDLPKLLDLITRVVSDRAQLEGELPVQRAKGWRDALSCVQYCVANWLQDCRTDARREALVDAGRELAEELCTCEPTDWLNTKWKSTQDWMAKLSASEAEATALRAERDELLEQRGRTGDWRAFFGPGAEEAWRADAERYRADLSSLKQRVAEVLEPFAANPLDDWGSDDLPRPVGMLLKVGDFRRAAELHASLRSSEGQPTAEGRRAHTENSADLKESR